MSVETILPDLPPLEWVQILRDPIWGEIPITAVEKRIIQTEAFYRLRGIKQLSFAYLAFPGAVHSRFEHSIGVMHATDEILRMVRRPGDGQGIAINSYARQLLRLAALLHDIGHPPFSHAIESLFTFYPELIPKDLEGLGSKLHRFLRKEGKGAASLGRHETFTEFLICCDEDIGAAFECWVQEDSRRDFRPLGPLEGDLTEIVKRVVAKLAVGELPPETEHSRKLLSLVRVFKSLMSGDIDADKIDYLMRDNYYCGLPYNLDLAALRDCLTPKADSLQLEPEAKRFVHSLVLARFRLITEVHHNPWNVFATSMAIERLNDQLRADSSPGGKILEIYTQWNDANLLASLQDGWAGRKLAAPPATAANTDDGTEKDPFREVLTTQYPLEEIARLAYLDTHPYIRECIQILSEPVSHRYIPFFQRELREITGRSDLYVHIQSVKSPEFSMKLIGGGELLRDEIIRGISEESIKTLHVIVYGRGDLGRELSIDFDRFRNAKKDQLPCESCPIDKDCPGNLERHSVSRLLAELAVWLYRQISADCGTAKVIPADFLLLLMEKVHEVIEAEARESEDGNGAGGGGGQASLELHPIRQDIYAIAKKVHAELPDLEFVGRLDLSGEEITSGFYQEIRKYEQLGLMAFSRQIRELKSEDGTDRVVYRFDRRFRLSDSGRFRLEKVRMVEREGDVEAYREYIQTWERIAKVLDDKEEEIRTILKASAAEELQPPE